ncbi:LysR family transcriptional regulator [Micromonosporaceae bacterium Da 78-11]
MRETQLPNIDLNLLPALVALLDEQHISRAADRIALSQSAMSRSLQRLRRTLGDDLLVRAPGGYRLTPRAERVREQLSSLMPQLNAVLSPGQFDPATASQTIQVSGSDYAVAVIGLELSRRVVTQSPLSSVRFCPMHQGVLDDMIAGRGADLAFFGAPAPAGLHSRELFRERFVCLVAADHPLADRTAIGLPEYLRYRHLTIDIADGRQPAIDDRLAAAGRPRDVASTMPFHAVAPWALPGTELILTYPELLISAYVDTTQLRVLDAPSEINTMTYRMAWHPRMDADPAHRWLRETVRGTAPSSGIQPTR